MSNIHGRIQSMKLLDQRRCLRRIHNATLIMCVQFTILTQRNLRRVSKSNEIRKMVAVVGVTIMKVRILINCNQNNMNQSKCIHRNHKMISE